MHVPKWYVKIFWSKNFGNSAIFMRGTSETQDSRFLPTFWFLGSIVSEILYAIFPTSWPVRSTGVPASILYLCIPNSAPHEATSLLRNSRSICSKSNPLACRYRSEGTSGSLSLQTEPTRAVHPIRLQSHDPPVRLRPPASFPSNLRPPAPSATPVDNIRRTYILGCV